MKILLTISSCKLHKKYCKAMIIDKKKKKKDFDSMLSYQLIQKFK